MNQVTYLSQDVSFLDVLRTQRQALHGFGPMVQELVQNAEDAAADWLSFEIKDEGLMVRNSSTFSDCGQLKAPECSWANDDEHGYPCDFHRMRAVLGGGKKQQRETIGTFGVGFISVYTLTDRPEIKSGRHHWTIRPLNEAGRRIEDRPLSPCYDHTEIFLPWAMDGSSKLRRALEAEPVDPSRAHSYFADLLKILPSMLLFLHNLKRVKVVFRGLSFDLVRQRQTVGPYVDTVTIAVGSRTMNWRVYWADFDEEAQRLRAKHNQSFPLIEDKRRSKVEVAIREDREGFLEGRLFAFLPSETSTSLSFHINADFFVSPERKQIHLGEGGYESEWNNAALNCAAKVYSNALEEVGRAFGAETLFGGIRAVSNAKSSEHFGHFWEEVRAGFEKRNLIPSTEDTWTTADKVALLRNEQEHAALDILNALDIHLVHPDMRRFYSLMLELGVRELDADALYRSLEEQAIVPGCSLVDAPAFLQDPGKLAILYDQITLLHRRRLQQLTLEDRKRALRDRLSNLPIAVSIDRHALRIRDVFRADERTRRLFGFLEGHVHFADTAGRTAISCSVVEAIAEFDALASLSFLETAVEHNSDLLLEVYTAPDTSRSFPNDLYLWFARRRQEFEEQPTIRERYKSLPIFLSRGEFRPLTALSLPGDFTDPLQLDILVSTDRIDEEVIAFWASLGVPRLSLTTYVRRHLVQYIEEHEDLEEEDLRSAVRVLATNLGKYRDDPGAIAALSDCPIAICSDGKRRPPRQVYFPSEEIEQLLGTEVSLLESPPTGWTDSMKYFYEAVGVVEEPRPTDLLHRIEVLTAGGTTPETRNIIEQIFFYLNNRWASFSNQDLEIFNRLKWLAWLPEIGNEERWCRPPELYARSRSYLFYSQARFVDFGRTPQREFLDFLGLKVEPTTQQVVNHLIWSSRHHKDVNPEVYRFLQQTLQTGRHADETQVLRLEDEECINVGHGIYHRPELLFWSDHPFGKWRYRLADNLREYSALFSKLGVRDDPSVGDYVSVVLDISARYTSPHRTLEDDDYAVIRACYADLSRALVAGETTPAGFERLRDRRVVPNSTQRMLYPPKHLFFEDKVGYRSRFQGILDHFVIPKERETFPALKAIGVRPLSQCVRRNLVECKGLAYDPGLTLLIRTRIPSIRRVVERQQVSEPSGWQLELLEGLETYGAVYLSEKLEHIILPRMESPSGEVPTFFDANNRRLYVKPSPNGRIYLDMAKEIAAVLNPDVDTCNIIPVLKDILSVDSSTDAEEYLLSIGYEDIREGGGNGYTGKSPIIEAIGGGETTEGAESGSDMPEPGADEKGGEKEKPTGEIPVDGTAWGVSPIPSITKADAGGAAGKVQEREGPRSDRGRRSTPRPRSRLRSYVETEEQARVREESEIRQQASSEEEREEIEESGMRAAMEYERAHGRIPERLPHYHEGWDIESYVKDPDAAILNRGEHLRLERYIEVKATKYLWDGYGIGMTPAQFRKAQKLGTQYFLYVVDRALDPGPHPPYVIQGPARKVAEFRFDDGWKDAVLAVAEDAEETDGEKAQEE